MLNQMNSAVYYGGTFDLSGDTPLFTKPAFEYQETTHAGAVWRSQHLVGVICGSDETHRSSCIFCK